MQARERLGPVSMTGPQSVWTVAAKVYPLLTRLGSGLVNEGGRLPVQDRRDNYRIVREDRGVAAAVMDHDYLPLQGYRCSRSRMRIGQHLHSLAKPSCQPLSPTLPVAPESFGFRLHFALRFQKKIPCSLLHWHVLQGWDLIGQMSLLKDQKRGKIPLSLSRERCGYFCQLYLNGPEVCLRSIHQVLPEQAIVKRHWDRDRFPVLSPRIPGNSRQKFLTRHYPGHLEQESMMKVLIGRHGQPGLAGI
jgi:hypothetical protein